MVGIDVMTEAALHRTAKAQMNATRGLYRHAMVYTVVDLGLFALSMLTSRDMGSARRFSVAPPLSRRTHTRPICGWKERRSISVRHGGAPATDRSR
jgi:hypothetical protein